MSGAAVNPPLAAQNDAKTRQVDAVADAWLRRADEAANSNKAAAAAAAAATGPAAPGQRRGITRELFAELMDPDEVSALMTFPF